MLRAIDMASCWRMRWHIFLSLLFMLDPYACAWRLGARGGAKSHHALSVTARKYCTLLQAVTEFRERLPDDKTLPQVPGYGTDSLPSRSLTQSGYRAPEEKRSWKPFKYSSPEDRRAAVNEWVLQRREAGATRERDIKVPMKIVLLGGPASGKGTVGMMLSQGFRLRVIGAGSLMRGKLRAGSTALGEQVAEKMARGDLLPDNIVLPALRECLDCWDVRVNGWLLDGFPRTASQVQTVLSDEEWSELRPDAVIVLERPDELVKEFVMGRMTDRASGQTYHPEYAPPPPEIYHRIMWRLDDTLEALTERIREENKTASHILDAYAAADVPIRKFNNARSEIETFREVADFIEELRAQKIAAQDAPEKIDNIDTGEDVEQLCGIDDDACIIEYDEYEEAGKHARLLTAARRCNTYNLQDFVPVTVGLTQVGWASMEMLGHLKGLEGPMCRFVYLDPPASIVEAGLTPNPSLAIELAPLEQTESGRTEVVQELVRTLIADGVIATKSLRNELQEVRPLEVGFVGPDGPPPLLRMERAAMIYFGVPSYGVHINGYVRDPEDPKNSKPHSMWIAKRSLSKATYPGMLDQFVAGGQPSSSSLLDNMRKECEEEASLPPEVVASARATGLVSYRYATRKGLSTKRLITFDVEMPHGLVPICADGEVEEFKLIPVTEMLDSIRRELPLWKPNSALVAIDFAMRHGLISPDEPGFVQLAQKLRSGV